MDISTVVRQLRSKRDRAVTEVQRLDAAIAALNGTKDGKRTGRRALSPAARAKIAAAQRARWATFRAGNARPATAPKKRTMSAAAKAEIAKAQRARWAKQKKSAAQKMAA